MTREFAIHVQPGAVQLWATKRLQFEPRGWQQVMKAELRDALTRLPVRAGHMLDATYAAVDDGAFVDLENVLLYNPGSSAVGRLLTDGVRFERSFVVPAPPLGCDPMPHFQQYFMSSAMGTPSRGWEEPELLASFTGVRLLPVPTVAGIFTAIRGQAVPPERPAVEPRRFTLRLRLGVPAGQRRRLTVDLVKRLIDGVVVCYHSHVSQGDDQRDLARRASAPDTTVTLDMLHDEPWSALGARRLLWPRGAGVQWNPADDYCVACEVTIDTSHARGWTLSGSLSAASYAEGTAMSARPVRPSRVGRGA